MAQEVPAVAITRLQRIWEDEVRPSARRALIALTAKALAAASVKIFFMVFLMGKSEVW